MVAGMEELLESLRDQLRRRFYLGFMVGAVCAAYSLLILILFTPLARILMPAAPLPPDESKCFDDHRQCMLTKALVYSIGRSSDVVIVPAGFVTDFASVPQFFWSVLSPHDRYSKAAIVHDYLYWTQACTREQADNLLDIAMTESNVSFWKQCSIYEGVHFRGERAWRQNRDDRLHKLPRIIPDKYRDFSGDTSWEAYRVLLKNDGVPMDIAPQQAGYCELGNTAKVPN
jgi:hypothetical protein